MALTSHILQNDIVLMVLAILDVEVKIVSSCDIS